MKFTQWMDAILMDENGAGGAPAGAAATGSDPASAAPPSPSPANPAAGEQQPAAAVAPDAPPAAQIYKPEGLPDHMLGKTDNETIDKLTAALKGYRDRDGQIPDKPEAYKDFGDVAPEIKPYVDQLASDPLFDRMTQYAKDKGIPLDTFRGMTTHLMTLGAEMGIFEPPLDVEAEKAALTPDTAKHLPPAEQKAAREQRMNDNFAWLDLQVRDGGLTKAQVDNAKLMLGDTAAGHQFFEYFRSRLNSSQQIAIGGATATQHDARAQLYERLSAPEMQKGHPKFEKAKYDQLMSEYQRILG